MYHPDDPPRPFQPGLSDDDDGDDDDADDGKMKVMLMLMTMRTNDINLGFLT